MNAVTEPTNFTLPKKPRVKEQEAPPDQRKFCVIPIRAVYDKQLSHGMLKTLMLICSYMNRSGITWVSQKSMADRMEVSQQAISKHLVKLIKAGYLEVLRKPTPGERSTTWRVIFDPSIKAEDAISITSSIEDTRPPYMKEQQAMQAEQPDPEGQRRVAQLIAKALKQPPKPKERTMPKSGETMTVKKMKSEIKKAQSKGSHTQPPEVVPASPQKPVDNHVNQKVQIQPNERLDTTSRGCTEHKNTGCIEVIKEYLKEDCLIQLHNNGLTDEVIADNLSILLDTYRSEGLTPKPDQLVQDIIQLSKVG